MSYTSKTMTAGEQFIKSGKYSLRPLVIGGILTLGLGFLATPFVLWAKWGTEMEITSKRVVYRSGIIRRNTVEMDRAAIESVMVKQGILGRIFGYGEVLVSGRGNETVRLTNVNSPLKIRQALAA